MGKASSKAKVTLQPLAKGLSGTAGQYFVAAELSRRGIIATVTLRNARGIDVLASSATRLVSIQVKTNQYAARKWLLDKKAEVSVADDLFYIFVNLNGAGGVPTYHVVESREVARQIRASHREWLAGNKKDGGPRKDTNMRVFLDPNDKHLNAWEQLGF